MEEDLRDKEPINTPKWMFKAVLFCGVGFCAILAFGALSNVFAPKATVFDIESDVEPVTDTATPPEFKSRSERQREDALSNLRTQCNEILKNELESTDSSLLGMRAWRWSVYAQKEAPSYNMSSYQFLTEKLKAVGEEIKQLAPYGSLEPLPEDTKKLRQLLGTFEEISLAITTRPSIPHPNVNMVDLNARIGDCVISAMLYNNVLEYSASDARNYQGEQNP